MNENESIKYNKEILTIKIQYRIVVMCLLFGLLLLCIFVNNGDDNLSHVFNVENNLFYTLLGGVISLFITVIYSLVDLYARVFEDMDKERTKFISNICRINNDYNKTIKDILDKIKEGDEGISKSDPANDKSEKIKRILNIELNKSETYSYIIKLNKFIEESQNMYTFYSQIEEYKIISDYIKRISIWINSYALLKWHKEERIEEIDVQDRFILIITGTNDELKNAIEKAKEIIDKQFEEIDIKESEYFENKYPGNILQLHELSIYNKVDQEMYDLLKKMDSKKHKEETRNIFQKGMVNAIKSDSCIYMIAIMFIIIMYFM